MREGEKGVGGWGDWFIFSLFFLLKAETRADRKHLRSVLFPSVIRIFHLTYLRSSRRHQVQNSVTPLGDNQRGMRKKKCLRLHSISHIWFSAPLAVGLRDVYLESELQDEEMCRTLDIVRTASRSCPTLAYAALVINMGTMLGPKKLMGIWYTVGPPPIRLSE